MDAVRRIRETLHPITVEPTGSRVRVRVGATVVAETDDALTLREPSHPPVQYLPLDDVDTDVLTRTQTTTHCPFKGDASYYSVTTEEGTVVDAGWTYEQPHAGVSAIAGHVAFYPHRVTVEVD